MESLNTRTDVEVYLEKYPEEAALFLRKTLAESKGWVLVGKLADGEPDVAEASRKSMKVFDEAGASKERYLYEYKEDPGSKLFRLGFSVKEVEVILLGLGVDLEAVGSEQEVFKTAVTEKWTAIEVQAAAQAVISSDPVRKFDSKQFFGRLIQEFDQTRWFALSKLGVGWTMQQLVDYPNFAGLKAYANGLLLDGTIAKEDALIINNCLLEQGIILENF